jgi:hypothetical protein
MKIEVSSSTNNNQKGTYQLWTDGKGSFAVKKKKKKKIHNLNILIHKNQKSIQN